MCRYFFLKKETQELNGLGINLGINLNIDPIPIDKSIIKIGSIKSLKKKHKFNVNDEL